MNDCINLHPLIAIARAGDAAKNTDDLAKFDKAPVTTGMRADIAEQVEKLHKEKAAEKTKDAAIMIVKVLEHVDAKIAATVERVRKLRAEEATLLARLRDINDAQRVANRSGNYLPLVHAVGIDIPVHVRLEHGDLIEAKPVAVDEPVRRRAPQNKRHAEGK